MKTHRIIFFCWLWKRRIHCRNCQRHVAPHDKTKMFDLITIFWCLDCWTNMYKQYNVFEISGSHCVKTLDMWGLLMFLLKKNTRKIKVPMIERLKKMLRKSLTLKPIWTISRDSLNPCVLWHKHWSTSAGLVPYDTYQQYSNMHFPLLGTRWRTHISVSLAAVCS